MNTEKRNVIHTPLTVERLVRGFINEYIHSQQTDAPVQRVFEERELVEQPERLEAALQMQTITVKEVSPYTELLPLIQLVEHVQGSNTTLLDTIDAVIAQNTPEAAVEKLFPVFADIVQHSQNDTPVEVEYAPIKRNAMDSIATVASTDTPEREEPAAEKQPAPTQEPESVKEPKPQPEPAAETTSNEPAETPVVETAVEPEPQPEPTNEDEQEHHEEPVTQEAVPVGVQVFEVPHYDETALRLTVLPHSDPHSAEAAQAATELFTHPGVRAGIVLQSGNGTHVLRANPDVKVELRDVVRVIRVEEARKRGINLDGESSRALSKPGELNEMPGWNFEHQENVLMWEGPDDSQISPEEMMQAVYAGLSNELLEANCPPVGCRGPECYFFMYQLPRCKERKRESNWKANGTIREPEEG